ncbi:MAG: IspD/TarI family cytidylyltransferase [Sphaerochaetaceae bacterium]
MSFPAHGVIITAAGNSSRFNSSLSNGSVKKEFMLLDDRSVLYHATLPFLSLPNLELVIVTYQEGQQDETEVALDNLLFASEIPVMLVQGGSSRQESVLFALETMIQQAPQLDYVLIHDGARPWVSEQIIISTLAMATVFGAAAPTIPIHDAVKKVDSEGKIIDHIDRNGMVTIQTPQAFKLSEILAAHRKAALSHKTYVDDTEIFTDFGGFVGSSAGEPENKKITLAHDMGNKEVSV